MGLLVYYPFNTYTEDLGIQILTPSSDNQSGNDLHLTRFGGEFSVDEPGIALARPVEKLNFDYTINNDQIIIELLEPAYKIENSIIDISVSEIRDLNGNRMSQPKTWSVFIDKNQVYWEKEFMNITLDNNANHSFTVDIINEGGTVEEFSLANLPSYITASPTSGKINPRSRQVVTFNIQSQIGIGTFEEDVYVETNAFKYSERLLLQIEVAAPAPEWDIIATNFSSSMNLIGEFYINDIISTDQKDIISVWINNELRGVAHIQFDKGVNRHLVYITVFSNNSLDGLIEFKAWDASTGKILSNIIPSDIQFIENTTHGSRNQPIYLRAGDYIELEYSLNKGWNWISFPLASSDLNNIDIAMHKLSAAPGDLIKNQQAFASYDGRWRGTLNTITNIESYKVKVDSEKSFSYAGEPLKPDQKSIPIGPGWNWIPYHGLKNMPIATALSSIEPVSGSVIKGQRTFAIYEEGFGWGGPLTYLEPLNGYVLYHHENDELTYPSEKSSRSDKTENLDPGLSWASGKYSGNMSIIAIPPACLLSKQEYQADDWLLVAYAGTEIRGIGQLTLDHDDIQRYYLSIEGEDLASLQFELVHRNGKSAYALDDAFSYQTNAIIGSISKPYEFSCATKLICPKALDIRSYDDSSQQYMREYKAVETISLFGSMIHQRHYRFRSEKEVIVDQYLSIPTNTIVEIQIGQCND